MSLENAAPRPFASSEQASAYFAARPHSEDWTNASAEDKEKALALAALLIDAAFVFEPSACERGENGETRWNERVVAAVCEQALWTLRVDPSRYPEILAQGIARVSVGDLSVAFDRADLARVVAPIAKTLVGKLGVFVAENDASDAQGGTITSTPLAL